MKKYNISRIAALQLWALILLFTTQAQGENEMIFAKAAWKQGEWENFPTFVGFKIKQEDYLIPKVKEDLTFADNASMRAYFKLQSTEVQRYPILFVWSTFITERDHEEAYIYKAALDLSTAGFKVLVPGSKNDKSFILFNPDYLPAEMKPKQETIYRKIRRNPSTNAQ